MPSVLGTNVRLRLAGQDRISMQEGDDPWQTVWLEQLERGAEDEPADSPTRKVFEDAVRLHDEAASRRSSGSPAEVPARRYESYKVREARERQFNEEAARREERWVVGQERRETAADDPWWPVCSFEVPAGIRWDTPGANQGQIVEVSYGTFGAGEAGPGDGWMRVIDRSEKQPRYHYYRLRTVDSGA